MNDKKGIMTQVKQAGQAVVNLVDEMLSEVMSSLEDYETGMLTVSIMGQTGVGKSSLMNAMLGTGFTVNPVRPGTLGIQEEFAWNKSNQRVRFYDLPGFGESQSKDEEYIQQYRNILLKSDVAIWAVLADTRSFSYDHDTLEKTLGMLHHQEQLELMDKIVFVLTKVDMLTHPKHYAPWTLTHLGADHGIFETHPQMEALIREKEIYFREKFLSSFRKLIRCRTYHRGSFPTNIPGIERNGDLIYYNGFLTEELRDALIQQYKQHKRVFTRLYDSTRTIPCSSQFRYNLDLLSRIIVEKLATSSAGRFKGFVEKEPMNKVSFAEAKKYANMILFDKVNNKVHDLNLLGGEGGS